MSDVLKQFQELTQTDEKVAKFYMESANGDLDLAVSNYFQFVGGSAPQDTTSTPTPTTTSSTTSSTSASSTSKKQQQDRRGMHTFNDFSSNDDDHSNANKYYAGGSTNSGNLILGRDDAADNNANDLTSQIFKKAQESMSSGQSQISTTASQEQQNFVGKGYRLGSQPSDATPQPSSSQQHQQGEEEEKTVTITFYQEGFTIDDGDLRRFDDEKNRQFLEAINNGYVPREVAGMAKEVLVNLVDKKSEKYAPPKKSFQAFKGEGRSLGAPRSTPTTSTPVQPVTPPSYSVDPNRPSTTLQIRLHDGTRLNATFNLDTTVQTLIQFVQAARPNVGTFQLQTSFPRKILTDPSQTIEQAGLKGAVLLQTLL